jgi:hypothetical protein
MILFNKWETPPPPPNNNNNDTKMIESQNRNGTQEPGIVGK